MIKTEILGLLLIILCKIIHSQVLSEIMFFPSEANSEFIEIYNEKDVVINLENFMIKYHNSSAEGIISNDSNYSLLPGRFAVVFEGDYNFENGAYDDIGDDSCLVFIIDDNSFGRSGMANSSARKISLIDKFDDTVDVYNYSPDNLEGYSDERIDYQSNTWKNTVILNGTPGAINSISPKEYDLSIIKLSSSQNYALVGDSLYLHVTLKNMGIRKAENFELSVYLHINNRQRIYNENLDVLNSGDSVFRQIAVNEFLEGDNVFSAVVDYLEDKYDDNDTAFLLIKGITANENKGDLVVNEFMYSPRNGESEWIEIFNKSEKEIDLLNYRIADNSDTFNLVWNSLIIDTNSYLVFADDSSFISSYNDIDNFLVTKLPALNNSGDDIVLLDSLNRIIDSLTYISSWGGKNGKSIERIDPYGLSVNPLNWRESLFPTPGKINSVTQKEEDLEIDSAFTDPFYPLVNSKAQVLVKVDNVGRRDSHFLLQITEDKNNDGKGDKIFERTELYSIISGTSNIVRSIAQFEVSETKRNLIIELLPLDDDSLNNKYVLELYPSFPPQTVIISEIMYSPLNYEPEWVELYNNSLYEININYWQISDVLTNPSVKRIDHEIVFPSKSFLVITKSESIFDYHRNIQGLVIKIPFANLNNDSDGFVIRDQNSRTIDSIFYKSSWGGNLGRSLEKRDLEYESNLENNWDSSIDIEGSTPGRINSISPKKFDLSISALYTEPRFPVKGDRIFPWVKIQNLGNYSADSIEVEFFAYYENKSHSMVTVKDLFLDSADSLKLTSGSALSLFDTIRLSVRINFSNDEDLFNNYLEKIIVPGFNEKAMLINEIMFKTKKGEPEWIEIINNSDSCINIKNWQIGDSKLKTTITNKNYYLNPQKYLVLSDYLSFPYFPDKVEIIEIDFPNLGDKRDAVVIYDFRDGIIDSMFYEVSGDFEFSTSLERISLKLESEDNNNWIFSLDEKKSTPGRMNSILYLPNTKFGDVIITEIMFNPNDNNCEFIELFNPSSERIELGGWRLSDGNGEDYIIKNQSFHMNPNEYFIISADSSILNNYPYLWENPSRSILDKNSLNLTNEGKLIYLRDTRNQTVDSLSYSEEWHNSAFLKTKNISLELINLNLLRNDKNNWSSSVNELGATPGKQNSINVENIYSSARLEIVPNPFSPDNDGFEDFTYINYRLTKPVSEIRIRIFDSKGRFVRSLVNVKSVGSTGTIIFDGLNNEKRPLKVGIYIILFETISKGNVADVMKEIVVVARKI